MAISGRLAVFNLLLVLLAGPAWAEPVPSAPSPPAASFPVDPPPPATPPAAQQPPPEPVPAAPPPPPGAVSPPPSVPPAAAPSAASAAPVAPPPPSPSELPPDDEPPRHAPRYDDYRLQLVASDVIALGLAITAASLSTGPTEELGYAALGVYALGAPIVHAANGQPLRGLASAGMRVGFPFAGAIVGVIAAVPVCAAMSDDGWGCVGAIAVFGGLGMIAGGLTAVIIDDGFFGKVEIKEPAPESALRRRPSVSAALVPLLDPHRKTLGASLVGSF